MKKLILFLFLGIFLFGLNNLFADDFNDCLDKEVKTAREAGVDDPVSEAKRICDIKSPKDGNAAESKEKSAKESSADSVSNELPTASINLFSGEKNIKSLDAKIPIAGLYFDFLSFATVHKFKELNTKVYLSLTGGYMQQTKATKKDIVHAETQTLISSREVEATTEIPIFDNVTYNHDSPIVSGPPNYNSSYQAVVCIFSNSSDSSECYQYDIINEETSLILVKKFLTLPSTKKLFPMRSRTVLKFIDKTISWILLHQMFFSRWQC